MEVQSLVDQQYNNLNHTRHLCPHIGPKPVEVMLFSLWWVRSPTPPHLYKPLGLWASPYPTVKKPFASLLRVGVK